MALAERGGSNEGIRNGPAVHDIQVKRHLRLCFGNRSLLSESSRN